MLLVAMAVAAVESTATAWAAGSSATPFIDQDDPEFLPLSPFPAPVLKGRQIERYVHLGITLELANSEVARRARANLPALRNAFIQDLFFQAQMRNDGRGVVLPRIKARFRVLAERVLGEDTVHEVLITEVLDFGS